MNTTDATPAADRGSECNDPLGVGAEDMAAMRMQATALAFQWFAAREYTVSSDDYAFFLLRARDFGFKDESLPGLRIRVALSFERDA